MKFAVIDGTGIRVSRLAFGTASLHHILSSGQRQRLLREAATLGITHYDTAPYYGYGLAERELGALLRERRDTFTVTTKVGLYPRGGASGRTMSVWLRKGAGRLVPLVSRPVVDWTLRRAKASLHESLRRLRTEYIDFLLLHEPDLGIVDTDEFVHWIQLEHANGTVRCWGLGGEAKRLDPWVGANHPLAKVLQTSDSVDRRQADFVIDAGRRLQFTYGYLASLKTSAKQESTNDVLRAAFARNSGGAIIVSTRQVGRIRELIQAVR